MLEAIYRFNYAFIFYSLAFSFGILGFGIDSGHRAVVAQVLWLVFFTAYVVTVLRIRRKEQEAQ